MLLRPVLQGRQPKLSPSCIPFGYFWGTADLVAEGDYVVGRWEGGCTHTGPAFSEHSVKHIATNFTGTTMLRIENGKIAEEIGLDDGVTALTQLGLIRVD